SIRPLHSGGLPACPVWVALRSVLVLVAEARPRPFASGVVAHGWNIDEESPCRWLKLVRPACGVGTWRLLVGGLLSTLLGPEATGLGPGSSPVWGLWGWVGVS